MGRSVIHWITLFNYAGILVALLILVARGWREKWEVFAPAVLCALHGIAYEIFIIFFRYVHDFYVVSAWWSAVFRLQVAITAFGVVIIWGYYRRQ